MSTRAAHINADRRVALFDSPVAISVSGLDPGERVTLTASATGCSGYTWMSNASFTADPSGNVDLATEAPTSGSYQGRQAMGLLWSLTPRVAFTTDETMCVLSNGLSLKLLAEAKGKLLASLTLTRLAIAPGVREQAAAPPLPAALADARLRGGGVSRQRSGTSDRRSLCRADTPIEIVIIAPTLAKQTQARSAAV